MFLVFFFKQKTAYEMRISDWSSDVCVVSGVTLKALESCLQVAFRVDQEVGGDHDLFSFGDPLKHFDAIATAPTQSDVARCEAAGAGLDQHHLARAAVEHGRARNGQDRSGSDRKSQRLNSRP